MKILEDVFKDVVFPVITGALVIIIGMITYWVRQTDKRLTRLENWRDDHEKFASTQVVEISNRLTALEVLLNEMKEDIKKLNKE